MRSGNEASARRDRSTDLRNSQRRSSQPISASTERSARTFSIDKQRAPDFPEFGKGHFRKTAIIRESGRPICGADGTRASGEEPAMSLHHPTEWLRSHDVGASLAEHVEPKAESRARLTHAAAATRKRARER